MNTQPNSALKYSLALLATAALGACTTVGPDFEKPTVAAPQDWSDWRSGDESLRIPVSDRDILPADWWTSFNDPMLSGLIDRAFTASPDLRTAAIHYAQALVARGNADAGDLPQVNASGQVSRQRQSENGAATRIAKGLGGNGSDLIELLGEPFTLYQGGLDLSWEIDLWGKVARSIEAADADLAYQAALLDLARLSIASNVAQEYFNLRATQRKVAMTRADIAALQERVDLLSARAKRGLISQLEVQQQRSALQAMQTQLPQLLAQEAALTNQLGLLLDARPGELSDALHPPAASPDAAYPDLALGLPSELALRRPDIRAAEARLHAATARIGVAKADLYPSIRLGGSVGLESVGGSNLFELASGTYGIGPSINLPLFDGGRRKRTVQLRELDQKEAAIAFQQTVLKAWQEIDDALNAYGAERRNNASLAERVATTDDAWELAEARYKGGLTSYLEVLDGQRSWLHARRDLIDSDNRLQTGFVKINAAIGNIPLHHPASS